MSCNFNYLKAKKCLLRSFPWVVSSIISISSSLVMATGQDFTGQQVKAIITGWGGEGIYLSTNNTNNSVDGCGPRFMLPVGSPMFNQILSIALTAYSTSATIILHVDGCYDSGDMSLKAIQIIK